MQNHETDQEVIMSFLCRLSAVNFNNMFKLKFTGREFTYIYSVYKHKIVQTLIQFRKI